MARRAVAVLRMADQRRDAVPDRCVVTGERTEGAVRAEALRLRRAWLWSLLLGRAAGIFLRSRRATVVLPVSPAAWWRVQRSLRRAVVVAGLGLGSLAVGALDRDPALLVLGALLLAVAAAVRAIGVRRWWVELRLLPNGDEVRVTRTSPAFAEEARKLYVRSIGGR